MGRREGGEGRGFDSRKRTASVRRRKQDGVLARLQMEGTREDEQVQAVQPADYRE